MPLFSRKLRDQQTNENGEPMRRPVTILTVVVVVIALGISMFLPYFSGIKADFSEYSITVRGVNGKSEVSYLSIESVELVESVQASSKINGWNTPIGGIQLGKFNNEVYGTYNRYTYSNQPHFIVIKNNQGEYIVFNVKGDEETIATYEELLLHVDID